MDRLMLLTPPFDLEKAQILVVSKQRFLQNQGYQEDFKPRPFIDSIEILNGKKERVFEGLADMFERPITPLDRDLDSPLLMYHGAADNNTGTFLIQSERCKETYPGTTFLAKKP